jgi:hypothetical protein
VLLVAGAMAVGIYLLEEPASAVSSEPIRADKSVAMVKDDVRSSSAAKSGAAKDTRYENKPIVIPKSRSDNEPLLIKGRAEKEELGRKRVEKDARQESKHDPRAEAERLAEEKRRQAQNERWKAEQKAEKDRKLVKDVAISHSPRLKNIEIHDPVKAVTVNVKSDPDFKQQTGMLYWVQGTVRVYVIQPGGNTFDWETQNVNYHALVIDGKVAVWRSADGGYETTKYFTVLDATKTE